MLLQTGPTILAWVAFTGVLLLIAVTPFGALFGFIMSLGLTRRLDALASAADAWSEGNFRSLPVDRSKDEIGALSVRLRNMAERVQNLMQTQQQLAQVEERNRLARELHDTVKQETFAVFMQVRAARNLLDSDPTTARKHLEAAEELIKTTQQDLGQIIGELRPAALEGQGLPTALRAALTTWSQHTRIPNTFKVRGERTLPLETEQALYRVSQEALSNIARHSHASAVTVRLDYEPSSVCLTIEDNGAGFRPAEQNGKGYGMQSMRERMAGVGGTLSIRSEPGSGTQLTATAPVR
jgi:NarL family two-component system sensor histidine kinase LiaS